MEWLLGCLLMFLQNIFQQQMVEVITVRTEEGLLRGRVSTTVYGKNYYSFRGIPYAKPPTGPLRFKSPEPLEYQTDIGDALNFGPECIQRNQLTLQISGEEDCLYINIYTPELPQEQAHKLPVIFWIHGGGFIVGSGDDTIYGPDFLLEYNVILVTFNYRLGVLGFLSTQDLEAPGNMGLKDQQFALKWVKNNINNFGGDPNNISVFGMSAGAASAHYHILSPMSKGLFQKVVALSGSALNPWSLCEHPRERAFKLGKVLGMETNSSQQLVNYLRNLEPDVLVLNANSALSTKEKMKLVGLAFMPSIEQDHNGAFLTVHPADLISRGNFTSVPFVSGFTAREGIFFFRVSNLQHNYEKMSYLLENLEEIISMDLTTNADKKFKAAQELVQFYFNGEGLTNFTMNKFIDLLGDMYMNSGVVATLRSMSKKISPVYQYRFSYEGNVPSSPNNMHDSYIHLHEATHASDESSLFYLKNSKQNLDPTSDQAIVRNHYLQLLTNFAKFGNPNADGIEWERFTLDNQAYLDINVNISSGLDLYKERLSLWRSLE